MANPVGTTSFTEWVNLQNFQVETLDEHGRCIQGTVVDRLDYNHLLVDFHCANNALRKIKNRYLFLAVSSDCLYQSLADITRKLIHVGTHVHVLVRPTSRRCPLTWYPGTVVLGSREAPLLPNQYHDWVLVDVALASDCHRVVFFTTRNSYACIVPNFKAQQSSRQMVRETDFVTYRLSIPSWIDRLRSRLNNPALFLTWLSDATCSKVLNLSADKVTLLRKQHDSKVASGGFWTEFPQFVEDSSDYDKQVLKWYLGAESQPVENAAAQRQASDTPSSTLDRTVYWIRKRYRKLLGHTPVAMPSQSHTLKTEFKIAQCKQGLLSEVPNELLVQIFGLLDVDEQITLMGVCSSWKDLIDFCRTRKIIISTPPCHDVSSTDGCREACGLRKLSSSICRYTGDSTRILIVKASFWDICVQGKRDGDNSSRSRMFPVHDFVRFLKYRATKVPIVVLCDTWLATSRTTKNADDFTSIADITGELVLRNARISSNVRHGAGENIELLTDPANASARLGPNAEVADRLTRFFNVIWGNLPGDQTLAVQAAFYAHGEWTESQRSVVRQHLARYDPETLRTWCWEVGSTRSYTTVDVSKLKNHTLISLLHLLDEQTAAEALEWMH